MPKKKTRSIPAAKTLHQLVTAAASKPDLVPLVPDIEDLFDDDTLEAMRDAYVRERFADDSQWTWADPATRERDRRRLYDSMRALSTGDVAVDGKALSDLFWLCIEDRGNTTTALDQEIFFQIGVEIGRRLSGGGR